MYNTVREKNTSFYYPDALALLAAKPREFLMRRVPDVQLYLGCNIIRCCTLVLIAVVCAAGLQYSL